MVTVRDVATVVTPTTRKTVTILENERGLDCTSHRDRWCECKVEMMRHNLDASDIATIGDDPVSITVPIMPTRDAYGSVWVVSIGVPGCHAVTMPTWPPDGEVTIGMLGPGEARAMIRLMIFEWLRFQWYARKGSCSNKSHAMLHGAPYLSASRFKTIRGEMDPAPEALTELFFVLTEGTCRVCSEYMNADQDIPEV
jgi:hypothetical protein